MPACKVIAREHLEGGAYPLALYFGKKTEVDAAAESESGDPCLHSIREVTGYPIKALDGEIGHVEDFILHDASWTIRYLVVDTRNGLPGRKVLVAPSWIDSVDWGKRRVVVNLEKDQIRESPQYDPSRPVNREYEERLYDFYGRPHDWV